MPVIINEGFRIVMLQERVVYRSSSNEGSDGATQFVVNAKGNAMPESAASVSNSSAHSAHSVGDGWTSARRYAFYLYICSFYCP